MNKLQLAALSFSLLTVLVQSNIAVAEPDSQNGKKIFKQLNCAQCHSVAGEGGCLGPPLDGVVKRKDAAYIRMRLGKDDELAFTKLIGHPELIPHPRFSKNEVSSLISYLSTLAPIQSSGSESVHEQKAKVDPASQAEAPSHPSSAKTVEEGKKYFYESGCMACHSVGGLGGTKAPALDGIGKRRNRAGIEAFIAFPIGAGAKGMPRPPLDTIQRQSLIDFLQTLPERK